MMKLYTALTDIEPDEVVLGISGECPHHKKEYINMLDHGRKVFQCTALLHETVHPFPDRWVVITQHAEHGTNP